MTSSDAAPAASMDTPLFSIIIPTFNHAAFLREALQSVLAQSDTRWEALVINNFSEDQTEVVVASLSDRRIKLFNFQNNGIIAASRNEGIRRAQGKYLAFLDADDRWSPKKLAQCAKVLEEGVDLVCHSERWFGTGTTERIVHYGPLSRARFESLLYEGNALSTSAVVARRKTIVECGGFEEDPKIVTAEDYDLWLRFARRGNRVEFLNEVLGEYRIHAGGQSRGIERNLAAELAVLERCYRSLPAANETEQRRRARRLAIAHYGAGRNFQNLHEPKQARMHLNIAFRLYPWLPKLWAAFALNLITQLRH